MKSNNLSHGEKMRTVFTSALTILFIVLGPRLRRRPITPAVRYHLTCTALTEAMTSSFTSKLGEVSVSQGSIIAIARGTRHIWCNRAEVGAVDSKSECNVLASDFSSEKRVVIRRYTQVTDTTIRVMYVAQAFQLQEPDGGC